MVLWSGHAGSVRVSIEKTFNQLSARSSQSFISLGKVKRILALLAVHFHLCEVTDDHVITYGR